MLHDMSPVFVLLHGRTALRCGVTATIRTSAVGTLSTL
ncbi:hypothetical protein APV28_0214 [Comamonas testosteroni]|nr:hypothetical protein APV28_0214 [Comamonas testosteroni]